MLKKKNHIQWFCRLTFVRRIRRDGEDDDGKDPRAYSEDCHRFLDKCHWIKITTGFSGAIGSAHLPAHLALHLAETVVIVSSSGVFFRSRWTDRLPYVSKISKEFFFFLSLIPEMRRKWCQVGRIILSVAYMSQQTCWGKRSTIVARIGK